MQIKLIDYTTDPLFNICYAARKCYNSWNKDVPIKRADFVKGLIKSGHETPLEFAHTMWEFEGISRVCQNQIVRHRIASYCVMSERYVDVSNLECVLPIKVLEAADVSYNLVNECKELYKRLIENDVPREDARMLLPQGLETKMCMDMNFRSLRHFLKLRLDNHAQFEIRQVAKRMYEICLDKFPYILEGIDAK